MYIDKEESTLAYLMAWTFEHTPVTPHYSLYSTNTQVWTRNEKNNLVILAVLCVGVKWIFELQHHSAFNVSFPSDVKTLMDAMFGHNDRTFE